MKFTNVKEVYVKIGNEYISGFDIKCMDPTFVRTLSGNRLSSAGWVLAKWLLRGYITTQLTPKGVDFVQSFLEAFEEHKQRKKERARTRRRLRYDAFHASTFELRKG